jgi:hypothetical protein
LQTSWIVEQLRLQVEALVAAVVVTGPTTTQAFWQFMAVVSQETKQAVEVDVRGDNCGWGAGSTVCDDCASTGRSACPKATKAAAATNRTRKAYRMAGSVLH